MPSINQGDRISNYLLEERVGSGSFGQVWRARHHVFDDVVAIKVPTNLDYVRNLQREGVAVHGLRHPNIVRALDLDPFGDPPYLVMEYVDGPSLRELIDKHGKKFPIPAVVTILRGILHALVAAHDNQLIHRDLKPANILIHQPPEDLASVTEPSVKVTDFGLGQVGGLTNQSIMQSGSLGAAEGQGIAGTLAYMSPEQKDGGQLDGRSDLFACGIMLFEMLTGERPQGGDLPGSLRNDVPEYLDEVFKRCYTRRDRRFESAGKMLEALALSVGVQAAGVPPPPLPPPTRGNDSRCPDCGRAPQHDDQFCVYCGCQLVAKIPRCRICQSFVHVSDRYCIQCGNDLQVLTA